MVLSPAERLTCPGLADNLFSMSNTAEAAPATSGREDVAAAVRAHLAVRKMSDSALGRMVGMSQSKISRRTNGEIAFDTDELDRIALALGMSIVELIQMPTKKAPAFVGGGRFIVRPPGLEPGTHWIRDSTNHKTAHPRNRADRSTGPKSRKR